jgi:hypothetical protein
MGKWIAALLLWFVASDALACSCPLYTKSWWESSDNVVLVRVDGTRVVAVSAGAPGPCKKRGSCVIRQSALFTPVERFKGSLAQVKQLESGYGSGDCGIPLVAGAYYVVFAKGQTGRVGFCNAAGPYPPRYPYAGKYPAHLEPFLASLRRAAAQPGARILPRPKPMTFDAAGGL